MDTVTRPFYELAYRVQFAELKGNAFQDFFSSLMEKSHASDFIRVRPWGSVGDQKNDGYLKSTRTLFQVYAPNELTANAALAKINEDFMGALPHWREHFDTWVFVHNSREGLGPEVTKKILELDQEHPVTVTHWGYEELRQKVFELKVEDIASLLGIAPSLKDLMGLGLEALSPVLDQIQRLPPTSEPDLRPPPADKIDRNLLSEFVGTLLRAGMSRVALVNKYFGVHPGSQDEVARVLGERYQEFRASGQSPDDVYVSLQRVVGGGVIDSAGRQSAVLAVLAFFFEECDIFERYGADGRGEQ